MTFATWQHEGKSILHAAHRLKLRVAVQRNGPSCSRVLREVYPIRVLLVCHEMRSLCPSRLAYNPLKPA